jgi:hypothetical protein
LSARQELTAIGRLFADDPVALQVIAGLGQGLSAEQIRVATGISRTDYDSARRRMRAYGSLSSDGRRAFFARMKPPTWLR